MKLESKYLQIEYLEIRYIRLLIYILFYSSMLLRSTPQEGENHCQFEKKCGSRLHNDTQTDNLILQKTSSMARLKSYKSLLENKLINTSDKYLCFSCLDLSKPVSTGNIPADRDCKSIEIDQQEPDCSINK